MAIEATLMYFIDRAPIIQFDIWNNRWPTCRRSWKRGIDVLAMVTNVQRKNNRQLRISSKITIERSLKSVHTRNPLAKSSRIARHWNA